MNRWLKIHHILPLSRLWLTATACALGSVGPDARSQPVAPPASGYVVREVPQPDGKRPLLAFGSGSGWHFMYDPNQLTMVGIWKGEFGRVENGVFKPDTERLKSFSLDRFPWSYGEKPRRTLSFDWHGYEIRNGRVWLRYTTHDRPSGMSWRMEETLEIVSDDIQRIRFKIHPSAKTDLYLNYWVTQTDFRRLATDGLPNQRNRLKNLRPNQTEFTITFFRRKSTPTRPHGYSVERIPIPTPTAPFLFEPTDIDFGPDGDVYVSTRTGQVWRRRDGRWTVFAEGLHEANGVRVSPGGDGVYVMQRPELTLLRDTDGDGVADVYRTVESRFRYTGHYHEFAYGPRIDSKGNLYFSLGLASSGYHLANPEQQRNQMSSALGFRGWVIQHTPDGRMVPFAAGLRSPAGIGMNDRDELFITDNQGDWVANSYLGHVEKGDFLGHPAALWDREEYGLTPRPLTYADIDRVPEKVPPLDRERFARERKPPAVWLAHGDLSNSPGHPSFAPKRGFGPFGGQVFIADIAHRNIMRVALEKVGGRYQGAVFDFIRPLSSSSYSTAFDPEGNLWVGSVGRGWTAGDPAIEVIRFDPSKTPFEMHRFELTRKGFDIHFTQPIARKPIRAKDVIVTEYRLAYWSEYGSEPMDERTVAVERLRRAEDGLRLSLEFPRKEGFIYVIQLNGLSSASGLPLENNYGVYTLNQLLP